MWATLREFFSREMRILTNTAHLQHGLRKKQLLTALGAAFTLGMATATGVVARNPLSNTPDTKALEQTLPMPAIASQLALLEEQAHTFIHQDRLQKGDTIAALLKRLSVEDPDAEAFIRKNSTARQLFRLDPGQTVKATTDTADNLRSLQALFGPTSKTLDVSTSDLLVIERSGTEQKPEFRAKIQTLRNDIQHEMRSGTIVGNFFTAMDTANVPEEIVHQMIDIFSGVIDFHHDIRFGDRFRIVYEAAYHEGNFVKNGRIVAVELINRGQTRQAVWYGTGRSQGNYYTFDGKNIRRAFLRAPLEFSRLSSGFGERTHPISQDWRMHQGIDFAAPVGTQVFAAGHGRVSFVGKQNGYGNLVILTHDNAYTTRYAHLSAFASGLKIGQMVRQGQVIAYVGQTGWATGPHLHYEFRHRDKPLNPLASIGLESPALTGSQRKRFTRYTAELMQRIDTLRSFNVLAANY